MEFVEPSDRRFEGQVATRGLELLHQVGGSGVEDAVAVLDEGEADAGGEMALAGAGRAEDGVVVAVVDPVASVGEDADQAFGQSGQAAEVEVVERLAGGQLGLGAVVLEASARLVGEFLFGQLGEVAVVGPAFALCPVGERPPHVLHGGHAQFLEHAVHLGVVHDEGLLGAHRASPSMRRAVPSRAGPSAGPSPLRTLKRPS